MQLFPRVWDSSNDQQHADFYAEWLGLDRVSDRPVRYESPTYAITFNGSLLISSDICTGDISCGILPENKTISRALGNKRDGNWISGISFIDNKRLGDQDLTSNDSLKHNKAHNKLYMLPFVLGIIGCVYHF